MFKFLVTLMAIAFVILVVSLFPDPVVIIVFSIITTLAIFLYLK